MEIKEILSRLKGVKQTKPSQWIAFCPVHDDKKKRSLSFSALEHGTKAFYCHAGCSSAEICNAIGISMRDLFPEKQVRRADR